MDWWLEERREKQKRESTESKEETERQCKTSEREAAKLEESGGGVKIKCVRQAASTWRRVGITTEQFEKAKNEREQKESRRKSRDPCWDSKLGPANHRARLTGFSDFVVAFLGVLPFWGCWGKVFLVSHRSCRICFYSSGRGSCQFSEADSDPGNPFPFPDNFAIGTMHNCFSLLRLSAEAVAYKVTLQSIIRETE